MPNAPIPRHDPSQRLATFTRFIHAVEAGRSLKEACHDADLAWGSVSRWIADTANLIPATEGDDTLHSTLSPPESYASRYARARLTSAEGFAERALDTAMEAKDASIGRLQVDTLKWRAAMADPKTYGDRKHVEVSGGIEHLHLDALRRISAKASIDNTLAPHTLRDVSRAVLLGDTVEEP